MGKLIRTMKHFSGYFVSLSVFEIRTSSIWNNNGKDSISTFDQEEGRTEFEI